MAEKIIGYLGPRGTFTHEAAIEYFDENNKFIACDKIADVFHNVNDNLFDFGVVPVENSVGGTITETIDQFFKTQTRVYDQTSISIKQALMSSKTDSTIEKIYAHDQSFRQCSIFIRENYPNAELIEATSNAKAAISASSDPNSASIGPEICAKEYNLNILKCPINDRNDNETKFFIISKSIQGELKDRGMMVFSLPNKSGALFRIIKIFNNRKINMTKIESRPSMIKKWEYFFIVEYELKNIKDRHDRLIKEVQHKTEFFKFIGSY